MFCVIQEMTRNSKMHNGDSLSLGVNLQYFFSSPLLSYLLLISEFSFLHSSFKRWRLVFWNSIHLEVASDSFCFLLYSSWLLVFILYVFELFFSFINLYCLKGLHFSQNNFLIFIFFIPYLSYLQQKSFLSQIYYLLFHL